MEWRLTPTSRCHLGRIAMRCDRIPTSTRFHCHATRGGRDVTEADPGTAHVRSRCDGCPNQPIAGGMRPQRARLLRDADGGRIVLGRSSDDSPDLGGYLCTLVTLAKVRNLWWGERYECAILEHESFLNTTPPIVGIDMPAPILKDGRLVAFPSIHRRE